MKALPLRLLALATSPFIAAPLFAQSFSADFEAPGYVLGAIEGQDIWTDLDGFPGALPSSEVSTDQNATPGGSRSLKIQNDSTPLADFLMVTGGPFDSGVVTISMQTRIQMGGSGQVFGLFLNDWFAPAIAEANVAFIIDQDSNLILFQTPSAIVPVPVVHDAWTELRAEYDFGSANVDLYYNSALVASYDPACGTITGSCAGYPNPQLTAISFVPIAAPIVPTPIYLDDVQVTVGGSSFGTNFCGPQPNNSSGAPATILGSMNPGVGSGLHLELNGGPSGELGYFLVGTAADPAPSIALGNGFLCFDISGGNALGRYNVSGSPFNSVGQFDSSGVLQNLVGTSTTGSGFDVPMTVPIPGSPTIMAGSTWHFQGWFRDTPAGVGQSNTSDGISVMFP